MPVLSNARHERFAQELAKGKTQVEAYTLAGYRPDDGAAARLSGNVRVQARVAELLTAAAIRVEITVHDIVDQLDEDRTFARSLEAPGPAITATMGKAKVLGFLAEKVEHTGKDGGPIEVVSDHDLAKLIAYQLFTAAEETAH
jgi:phage terminase small subunit